MRLEGRTAIVTGGAVGIGRHYSLALAAEGAQVMIADIKEVAVTAVRGPTAGTYRAGQKLDVTVAFKRPVFVAGGTPSLSLNSSMRRKVRTCTGPSAR